MYSLENRDSSTVWIKHRNGVIFVKYCLIEKDITCYQLSVICHSLPSVPLMMLQIHTTITLSLYREK